MADRKALSKRVRFEVFKRDNFKCQYCGKCAPEVILECDHISPVSKGGEDDIINLVTSCRDCNAGKSNVELSDASAIAKQRRQLEELNERREQLEMMLEWREAVSDIDEQVIDAACGAWNSRCPGYHLNENGRQTMRRLVKKWGIEKVLAGVETAAMNYLKYDAEGNVTQDSFELGLHKLGGILRMNEHPEWKRDLYYIRGILRNRIHVRGWQQPQIISDMESAIGAGITVEFLKRLALEVDDLDEFFDRLHEAEARKRGAS